MLFKVSYLNVCPAYTRTNITGKRGLVIVKSRALKQGTEYGLVINIFSPDSLYIFLMGFIPAE